ncbi:hypothetical protein [Peptostreptococcus porci]|uniref:hypothetical protein n=1 Tax=Peptostreptococcus porci TaxID=2652282 RepID=UPI002A9105B8|nr:hypothetical protein [Peptostreptococcus porci]MDY6231314.1 hypothetical protein [Peptostreptococcus porci]
MTKQLRKINIFLIAISFVISIIPFIGAYLIYYFTRTRLGMYRHMVYLNPVIESKYPINFIRSSIIIVIAISIIWMSFLVIKKRCKCVLPCFVFSILSLYYMAMYNAQLHKGYYISSMLVLIGVIFTDIWLYFIQKNRN